MNIKVDVYDLIDNKKYDELRSSCDSRHSFYAGDEDSANYHCTRNNTTYLNTKDHNKCMDCSPENCLPGILGSVLRNNRDLRRHFTIKIKKDIKSRRQDILEMRMQIDTERAFIKSLEKKLQEVPNARLRFTSGARKIMKIAELND